MCVRVFVCLCVCVFVCLRVCVFVCLCEFVREFVDARVRARACVRVRSVIGANGGQRTAFSGSNTTFCTGRGFRVVAARDWLRARAAESAAAMLASIAAGSVDRLAVVGDASESPVTAGTVGARMPSIASITAAEIGGGLSGVPPYNNSASRCLRRSMMTVSASAHTRKPRQGRGVTNATGFPIQRPRSDGPLPPQTSSHPPHA